MGRYAYGAMFVLGCHVASPCPAFLHPGWLARCDEHRGCELVALVGASKQLLRKLHAGVAGRFLKGQPRLKFAAESGSATSQSQETVSPQTF